MSDAYPMHESQFRFTSPTAAEQLGRCIRRGIEQAKAMASRRGGQRNAPRERDDLAERLAANGVLR